MFLYGDEEFGFVFWESIWLKEKSLGIFYGVLLEIFWIPLLLNAEKCMVEGSEKINGVDVWDSIG